MVRLYTLSGSKRGQEAEQILQQNSIEYQKIDVEKSGLLAEMDRSMGVTKLPVIEDNGQRYEGITSIREQFSRKAD